LEHCFKSTRNPTSGFDQHWNGYLDGVGIWWGQQLSDQEINDLYLCGYNNNTNALGYWNFEEGSGNTAFDLSPNGNDGIINGANYDTNIPSQSCVGGLTNANGCDSTAILNLTINQADTSYTNITACDSVVWNGTTYNQSGTYSFNSGVNNNYSLDFGLDAFNGNPIPPHNHVEIVNNINPTQEITIMGWIKIDGFDINDQRTFVQV
jgi:hypothetical protein